MSTTWLWRSPGGAGAVARFAADVRDPNSSSSKERVESLEAARHGARGTFEATGTKRQCFTGPQKRCSGPTRIFNTGDRGVARRPRAALHSGPANEALSGLGEWRRGAFEVHVIEPTALCMTGEFVFSVAPTIAMPAMVWEGLTEISREGVPDISVASRLADSPSKRLAPNLRHELWLEFWESWTHSWAIPGHRVATW